MFQRPNIGASIEQCELLMESMNSVSLIVTAELRNEGTPSIAEHYRLQFISASGKKTKWIAPLQITKRKVFDRTVQMGGTHVKEFGSREVLPEDMLYTKTEKAIEQGQNRWGRLVFSFNLPQGDFKLNEMQNSKAILCFDDVRGQKTCDDLPLDFSKLQDTSDFPGLNSLDPSHSNMQ